MSTGPGPAPLPAPTPRGWRLPKVALNPALLALVLTWILVGWYILPPIPHPHLFCWSPCPYCCPTLPPGPAPGPLPPAPSPTPPPTTAPLHATLIYNASDPTEALTAAPIRGDPTISDQLAALGCQWRTFDATAPEVAAANLLGYYKAAAGPAVVIQAEGTPKPVGLLKAPQSSAEVVNAVKKIRGK